MKIFSPAKVNLFLNVSKKRSDGYHELQTLFERLDFGDRIELKNRKTGIRLRASGIPVPSGFGNLAFRAAELIRRAGHVKRGVEIRLQKRIPVSAGLGGGSSNAAAVLIGLNRLWRLRFSKKRLMQLGERIGSDVPFFVLESPLAIARGRGERLTPVRGIRPPLWHCVVKPPFGISTKMAYKGLKPAFLTPPRTDVRMLVRSLQKGNREALSGLLTNSLEASGIKGLTTVASIKKKLVLEGAYASLMSGSGSAVFGLFRNEKKARRAAKNLKKKHARWQVFTAKTF